MQKVPGGVFIVGMGKREQTTPDDKKGNFVHLSQSFDAQGNPTTPVSVVERYVDGVRVFPQDDTEG